MFLPLLYPPQAISQSLPEPRLDNMGLFRIIFIKSQNRSLNPPMVFQQRLILKHLLYGKSLKTRENAWELLPIQDWMAPMSVAQLIGGLFTRIVKAFPSFKRLPNRIFKTTQGPCLKTSILI